MDDAEMRRRLKQEIDRMSNVEFQNITRTQNSFWEWIKRTARRIWNVVVDNVVNVIADWLWRVFFG